MQSELPFQEERGNVFIHIQEIRVRNIEFYGYSQSILIVVILFKKLPVIFLAGKKEFAENLLPPRR